MGSGGKRGGGLESGEGVGLRCVGGGRRRRREEGGDERRKSWAIVKGTAEVVRGALTSVLCMVPMVEDIGLMREASRVKRADTCVQCVSAAPFSYVNMGERRKRRKEEREKAKQGKRRRDSETEIKKLYQPI